MVVVVALVAAVIVAAAAALTIAAAAIAADAAGTDQLVDTIAGRTFFLAKKTNRRALSD